MENIKVYPVLATWKKSKKDGSCPIHINVDVNGKRAAFPSLGRKVMEDDWDKGNRKVKSRHHQADLINGLIRKQVAELEAYFMKHQLKGGTVTKEAVQKRVKNKDIGSDFYEFCRQQIELAGYAVNTKRVYTAEISKLKRFRAELSFADMDYAYFQSYHVYMRDKLENRANTIWKSFKFITTFLNLAVKLKVIDTSPMDEYEKQKYTQGLPDYLEWSEVKTIKEVLVKNKVLDPLLRECGYRFYLSCVSGLRFSDAVAFDYSKHVVNDNRIVLSAKKTGGITAVTFTDEIRFAVDWLKDKKPMKLTNQEFNAHLRVLGAIAGIDKRLKSHMGRHSFGMRCAELHMKEEDVQKLLGHKSRDNTRIYFRIQDHRLDEAMDIWNKA